MVLIVGIDPKAINGGQRLHGVGGKQYYWSASKPARAMCLGRHIFLDSCPSGQDILFTPEPGALCNIKVKADHCMILCHHKDLPVLPLHIHIATHIA